MAPTVYNGMEATAHSTVLRLAYLAGEASANLAFVVFVLPVLLMYSAVRSSYEYYKRLTAPKVYAARSNDDDDDDDDDDDEASVAQASAADPDPTLSTDEADDLTSQAKRMATAQVERAHQEDGAG